VRHNKYMKDGTLNGKFLVDRADGRTRASDRFFVVNYAKDPHARKAMEAYAAACEEQLPVLAADLREKIEQSAQADSKRKNPDQPTRGSVGATAASVDGDALISLVESRLADTSFRERLRNILNAGD